MATQPFSPAADSPASRLAAGRLALTATPLLVAGRQLELVHPQSVDDLICEQEFDADDRLPYWGTVWPSARVLARRIAAHPGRGRRLIDLGCGVGPVALAAALAGFDVLATDYYAEACEMTAANAQRNGIAGVGTRMVDWRNWPHDLMDFDCVVASDVLYERANAALVAEVFARALASDGIGWLTDPGRRVAAPFAAECAERGLACECIDLEQVIDGDWNCVVETYQIRKRG